MARKKHPSDSNKFKKQRHLRAKHQWQQNKDAIEDIMQNEQTIFDFMNKMKSVNEAASIKSYPAQALGRKRNMFMKALALDDDKFTEWVHNRLYRLAYDNQRSMTDFTPKDIALGLQKWENILRNGDPGFGQYDSQFKAYTDRFLKTATSILTNSTAGQGSDGTKPNEAPSLTPAGEPVSPTMLDYSIGGQPQMTQAQPAAQPAGQGELPPQEGQEQMEMGPSAEDQNLMSMIEEMQQAISMKDKDFMSYIEDVLMQHDLDPLTANVVEIEQFLDEQFQELIDTVSENSMFMQNLQELEAIYEQYKQKFIGMFEKMQGKMTSLQDKAVNIAAKRTEKIKKDASLFEIGIVSSSAFATQTPFEEIGLTEMEMKKLQMDQITYAAAKRITTDLFTAYPRLEKSKPYWMGRETNPSELSMEWSGSDASSVSDIVFDFGDKRVKYRNDKLVGCSKDDRNNNCISKIKVAVKINNMNVVPKNNKETKTIFDQVSKYLSSRDYVLDSDALLYQRLLADGLSPEQASPITEHIIMLTKELKEKFVSISQMPDFKKQMNDLLKDIAVFTKELTSILPNFKSEFIYSSLSGCGKFVEGSDREANFILSATETGENMVFVPLDRDLASVLANTLELEYEVLPIKNTPKDPMLKTYTDAGLTKQEAQQKIEKDYPYRINKFIEMVSKGLETSMMMDPRMAGTILPENSVLYKFLGNMKTLKEEEVPQEKPLQIDDMTMQYINASIEYAFSSLTNFIKFFGIQFDNVASTDFDLYSLFYMNQSQDMAAQLNNRVNMNNQIGDGIEQERLQNGIHNKWFQYKQKERPSV